MNIIQKLIIGFMVLAFILTIYLVAFNRPLYCKIAMFGQLNSVPAFCLKDAIKDVLKQ